MIPQSPSEQATWDITQFSQSLPDDPSYFPESHWRSEISSISKVNLVLGKARSHRVPNMGSRESESPTWFDDFTKNLWMRCDAWAGSLSWWSCQSPVAHSCGLLNRLKSFCRRKFKLNAKFDADLLLYLLSHFECDSHTVHMLTQWLLPPSLTSTVKLSLFTHGQSSPSPRLPGYNNVM